MAANDGEKFETHNAVPELVLVKVETDDVTDDSCEDCSITNDYATFATSSSNSIYEHTQNENAHETSYNLVLNTDSGSFGSSQSDKESEVEIQSYNNKCVDDARHGEQETIGKCTANSELNMPVSTPMKEEALECEICGHKFNLVVQFNTHMKTHKKEKTFDCEICGYKFTRCSNLKDHMRTHTMEKPFKCEICGYKSAVNSTLKKHMRTHTGEKPFGCEICGHKFGQRASLKRHKRSHTGERPFQCETCGFRFTDSSTLKKHLRTHTGERPFQCEICGYKSAVSGTLKKHMRTHLENVLEVGMATDSRPFK